jgi:MFS family permease
VNGLLLAGVPFGLGIGIATTAIYTVAGHAVSTRQRNVAFGYLTTAYLVGLAVSPVVAGLIGSRSMRAVFVVDALGLAVLTWVASARMRAEPLARPGSDA